MTPTLGVASVARAEVDTDLGSVVANGSDGSQVRQKLHAHFTINANGDVSVEFSKGSASC